MNLLFFLADVSLVLRDSAESLLLGAVLGSLSQEAGTSLSPCASVCAFHVLAWRSAITTADIG